MQLWPPSQNVDQLHPWMLLGPAVLFHLLIQGKKHPKLIKHPEWEWDINLCQSVEEWGLLHSYFLFSTENGKWRRKVRQNSLSISITFTDFFEHVSYHSSSFLFFSFKKSSGMAFSGPGKENGTSYNIAGSESLHIPLLWGKWVVIDCHGPGLIWTRFWRSCSSRTSGMSTSEETKTESTKSYQIQEPPEQLEKSEDDVHSLQVVKRDEQKSKGTFNVALYQARNWLP